MIATVCYNQFKKYRCRYYYSTTTLTGYRLIRIHLILFCVRIFQQKRWNMGTARFTKISNWRTEMASDSSV